MILKVNPQVRMYVKHYLLTSCFEEVIFIWEVEYDGLCHLEKKVVDELKQIMSM